MEENKKFDISDPAAPETSSGEGSTAPDEQVEPSAEEEEEETKAESAVAPANGALSQEDIDAMTSSLDNNEHREKVIAEDEGEEITDTIDEDVEAGSDPEAFAGDDAQGEEATTADEAGNFTDTDVDIDVAGSDPEELAGDDAQGEEATTADEAGNFTDTDVAIDVAGSDPEELAGDDAQGEEATTTDEAGNFTDADIDIDAADPDPEELAGDDAQGEEATTTDEAGNFTDADIDIDAADPDPEDFAEDDFIGLDDEDLSDGPLKVLEKSTIAETEPLEKTPEVIGVNGAQDVKEKPADAPKAKSVGKPASRIRARGPSRAYLMIALAVLFIVGAGGFVYKNPHFIKNIGHMEETIATTPEPADPPPLAGTVVETVEIIETDTDKAVYQSTLEAAGRLREELLEKKAEINRLILNYQDGIADLTGQVLQEIQQGGIASYAQASKNKRIELNLRTIQRRRAYIEELNAPIQWIEQGSETLLFLKRKAEFDLQLIDIAAGIDMDRHMRHLAAAIQKYRPSSDKLTIDPKSSDSPSLEQIWDDIMKQKKDPRRVPIVRSDAGLARAVCEGHFERTADLTGMTAETAKCLAEMKKPDLFLNGLKTLTPDIAKILFKWQGNWICLNGIEELTPEAARYLFNWKGQWISLNSLRSFPPEMAAYLMEWEGRQLELMGLQLGNKIQDQQTLKYLALWETTGGKLFISDEIRNQIKRALMQGG